MTPSTVAGRLQQPRITRRVSGPSRPAARGTSARGAKPRAAGAAATAATATRTPGRATARPTAFAGAAASPAGATAYAPLALRLARRCATVQDARLLDRLIRGRLWIGLIAAMLIGLVFVQLTLLNLNAGIGTSLERAATLERKNASLALEVSKLSAGQRVEDVAAARGMVMPAAGSVTYATAGAVPADVAVRGITEPKEAVAVVPAATATTTDPADGATADPAAAVSAATAGAPAVQAAPAGDPATQTTASATTATASATDATAAAAAATPAGG